ncbi:UNVERIFIED_CONTAM: Non-specific lipid-transfer protein 3 [Sesamum latifolium]|uniref:Non-specific lipid-transfer protein n=1 Tax=Sesamum latifolium TaxID=2727402 RepID=A0AAW2XD68_9LAMI
MEKAMCLVLAVTMVVVALAPPQAEAAMSCGTVANDLSPCINYVMYGGAGAPPATCCSGIKTLYNQASTTADRQAVCGCLKSVAGQASPTIVGAAAALPGKCGVSIPYEISPSTDCSKYKYAT